MKIHTLLLYRLAIVASIGLLSACEKDPINILNTNTYTAEGSLKTATTAFPVGLSIDYDLFLNNAQYRSVVAADAQSTTFGYHMKHGALVRNDGTIDFTKADALYDACKTAGIEVFGHTLGWHQNQNATYMKTITGGGSGPTAVNLLVNGSFENGSGDNFNNWGKYNGGSSLLATTTGSEVQAGTKALKVVVTADGNPWAIQMASDEFATTVGKAYNMTFFIKSATSGGQMRISTGGTGSTAQYSGNYSTSTDWVQKTYSFTANGPLTRVLIDIGSKANTYFVDNIVIVDAGASVPPTGGALVTAVDNALNDFITQTVTHYKGKVKAWDVVNEPVSESGTLRTDANTTVSATATDFFFWSKYLGRNWALKAFQYAAAADPTADLYINDYNLESNSVKLDSLIGYVAELKGKGAKITGIGTQMHVLWNTPYSGIDNMFKKLAATGLKVRISELDVRMNPNKKAQFSLNKQFESYQADMYAYIVRSYQTNVPVAQQSGITIWGISDNTSWLYENGLDFPLLFNKDYSKKAAYFAVLKTLKEK